MAEITFPMTSTRTRTTTVGSRSFCVSWPTFSNNLLFDGHEPYFFCDRLNTHKYIFQHPYFLGRTLMLFSQFPSVLCFKILYSTGVSCLGSGIDLDSLVFISSQQEQSPVYRPYSVPAFTKLKFSHFSHLISILSRMWAPLEPSFLIKIMQICTEKVRIAN